MEIDHCCKLAVMLYNTRGGQKVLSLDILDQYFWYCLYVSKTHLSCVLVWACWKCDITVIYDVIEI